ncbi:hypothetical protein [Chitinophaga arvensicola]|uniref:Preprotein translocase subunit SecD n=1 Tax=Chitinophaga arvensicola TaxID=29529 RepID=A0A1I0QKI7_9BACT|nr:hypothetical protein [Chitinophaga arvensicola]SEW27735.1 hypothetical protein SAMN04488122_1538 [Chitinophaga arvensicola]
MQRTLLLLAVLFIGCTQPASRSAADKTTAATSIANAKPEPFRLISGKTDSDSAVFEAAGITASIANAANGIQTIHITREGKRLINYMRAIDSNATAIPVPQLIITGTDTAVGFNTNKILFKIKDNRATYTKVDGPVVADSIKKAPADAGAF